MKELDQIGGDLREFIRVPAALRDEGFYQNVSHGGKSNVPASMLQTRGGNAGFGDSLNERHDTSMTMTSNFDFLGSTNMSKM